MTQENDTLTIIIKQMMGLLHKLNGRHPVTYEEAVSELGSCPTNDPMESGFQAGLEYSANLLKELILEVFRDQIMNLDLDDETIRAESLEEPWLSTWRDW